MYIAISRLSCSYSIYDILLLSDYKSISYKSCKSAVILCLMGLAQYDYDMCFFDFPSITSSI